MSQEKASERIEELLGYDDLNNVPTGPGRDYLTALVLVARGYNFGGITFQEAIEAIRGIDWDSTDKATTEKREILKSGRFLRFD